MAVFTGINVGGGTQTEVADALVALNRTLEWQMANLDSENVREIGGWRVGPTSLTSKDLDVGLSTDDSQPENIRFWAGSVTAGTAPFRVYDSGRFVATSAELSGDIHMTEGTITWGPVNAPLYSEVGGQKPPVNADNTDTVLLNGNNFTKVAGAYVYTGPADYSQITGFKPAANADNTAASLPSSLGINFTKIGSNYIYTGTLNANQINAGKLNANYINGGTISGVQINVSSNVTVGNSIYIGAVSDTSLKQIWLNGSNVISSQGGTLTVSSENLVLQGTNMTFDSSNITGLTATFG